MMNLGENLNDSFEYSKKLFSDVGRLIILIILSFIPIIEWIVLGYQARVLKESPGAGTPPNLENYGQLFVEGAKVFFAILIYMLVPTVLIVVGLAGTFAGLMSYQGSTVAPAVLMAESGLIGGVGLILILVGALLAIPLLIILGVGLAHMIKTGKFGKAFAFGEIFGIIRSIGWAKYLGWVIVTVVIVVVLGSVSGAIPIAGSLIAAIIQPIVGVFIFRSLGLLYNEGAPAELKAQAPVVAGLACASCGTQLQAQQKFCPNCGAAAPTPTPPPTAQAATKFCISCGAKIPANAIFCGSCGAKQT